MNENIYYLPRRLLNSLNGLLTGQKARTASLVTRPKAVLGSLLDSGKCFRFYEVFWILGCVLDSGKCFHGFWEVFCRVGSVLDPGKCFGSWDVFWILGRVFGFWEVFWILESVL